MRDIIYLHGFSSGPNSSKARFFRQKFEERGISITIPALDGGDFERLTLTGQLEILSRTAASRPVTLIGSSMGGYLAALYAARHPEVASLVLMAPAFCFARRWPKIVGEEAMSQWRETGRMPVFHYGEGRERSLSYDLIKDASVYEDYPTVLQPTLILHGIHDDVVPASFSEAFLRLQPAARLVILESGHELTDVTDRLWEETANFLGLPPNVPLYDIRESQGV